MTSLAYMFLWNVHQHTLNPRSMITFQTIPGYFDMNMSHHHFLITTSTLAHHPIRIITSSLQDSIIILLSYSSYIHNLQHCFISYRRPTIIAPVTYFHHITSSSSHPNTLTSSYHFYLVPPSVLVSSWSYYP